MKALLFHCLTFSDAAIVAGVVCSKFVTKPDFCRMQQDNMGTLSIKTLSGMASGRPTVHVVVSSALRFVFIHFSKRGKKSDQNMRMKLSLYVEIVGVCGLHTTNFEYDNQYLCFTGDQKDQKRQCPRKLCRHY